MKLDVKIMAHRCRTKAVKQLLKQLDRDVEVIWDEQPEPSPDPKQRWATGKRAWQAIDQGADWGMVLQDDILVAKDLCAGLEKALEQIGTKGLVSAYTGSGRPDQVNVKRAIEYARKNEYTWLSTRSLNWGPAIIMPTHTIDGMLEWCSAHPRANNKYDHRIGKYFRDVLHWRTWYTNPSLVEHRGLPSLVGHDVGPLRKAHHYYPYSALIVDWSRHGGLPIHTVP